MDFQNRGTVLGILARVLFLTGRSCLKVEQRKCMSLKEVLSLDLTFSYLTGCKVQKAYTSLGTSCHNAYTRFRLLFAHAFMHEQSTMGFGIRIGAGST